MTKAGTRPGTRIGLPLICMGLALALGIAPAASADWPEKPIRIVVPYGPGGGVDFSRGPSRQICNRCWGSR